MLSASAVMANNALPMLAFAERPLESAGGLIQARLARTTPTAARRT
jgi:hypothetical protein